MLGYGKIQYLQEKQGFIRSSTKIHGKRDILFFCEESEKNLNCKLQLGMHVRFRLVEQQKTNIKGGCINYWAEITEVCSDTESVSSDSQTSDSSLLSNSNKCADMNCSFNSKLVFQSLLNQVFTDLFKRELLPSKDNGCRNCWQL